MDARFARLMAAAQGGDREAYERLLRELLPALRALVSRRVADPSLAEDVVQNVLLQLHRARHTYRPARPFGPWLRTIARNASIDALRAHARRRAREVGVTDEEALGPAHPASDESSRGGALPSRLEEALGALPASQRQAFELLHVEELAVREAAARLGVSAGALKLRAHRARRRLRAWLEGEWS
ncbi:MAG TPA: sigma-70 family RNA polymerase sigma factor [Myxococcota bacterium]|nr:sigma-70 family RNA polymerase sigma factor [Myxococcota bacterium]